MTAGSVTIGDVNAPYWFTRTWSGDDGPLIPGELYVRPAREAVRYARRRGDDGVLYTVVVERHHIPMRSFRRQRRSKAKWNNYITLETTRHSNKVGTSVSGSLRFTQKTLSNTKEINLQNRLVEQARGHSFNAAVSGAELGKTVEMCAGTVVKLASSIRRLRRGDLPGAVRMLGAEPIQAHRRRVAPLGVNEVSSRWLEMQYGWKPLLSDVKAGAEAMAYHLNKPRIDRFKVSVFDSDQLQYSTAYVKVDSDREVYKSITCEMKEELSFARSLGLLDPLSLAWELLPFSFVADWFAPIGSYLENLNVIPNINARFLTSTLQKCDSTAFGISGSVRYSSAYGTSIRYIRTQSTSLTPVRPNVINWEVSSLSHFTSGLALLQQVIGGTAGSGRR